MSILGIVDFSPSIYCAGDSLGQMVPICIASIPCCLLMPSLPNWASDEVDPLRHNLISPPEVHTWSRGDNPIVWGRPIEYPSGRSLVDKALLKILPDNSAHDGLIQKVYEGFPSWLRIFKKYVQLFTAQIVEESNALVFEQKNALSLFEKVDGKYHKVQNKFVPLLTINVNNRDTSLNLKQLTEACRLASLNLEPRLEYRLLLNAYSALTVGDYRKSIIEAAVALETGLTSRIKSDLETRKIDFANHLLGKYKALGGKLELARILKIFLPDLDGINKFVIAKRNEIVHRGAIPDEIMARTAVEKVHDLLDTVLPEIHEK